MRNRDTDLDRDNDIDIERSDEDHEEVPNSDTGEILGIGRVTTGATGEIKRAPRRSERASADNEDDHITPLEDEVDLGARDVTKDGRGQTGPETGGHGSTPRRSGATGMDIG